MSWHKIELSAEQMANNETANMRDAFDILWVGLGHPKEFALFHSNTSNVTSITFISPNASSAGKTIIEKYQGQPCSKPSAKETGLLLGHADARESLLHF